MRLYSAAIVLVLFSVPLFADTPEEECKAAMAAVEKDVAKNGPDPTSSRPALNALLETMHSACSLDKLAKHSAADSREWRVDDYKDAIRGKAFTTYSLDGSEGSSLSVQCSNGKFDLVMVNAGSVIDYKNDGLGQRVNGRYRRDEEKAGRFYAYVTKDGTSAQIDGHFSHRMITPATRKLVIELPLYAANDVQLVFNFLDFKALTEGCRGFFKD